MNLVRWFRKNNKKILAVVVVIIMIGFVAGPALRHFSQRRMGTNKPIAYFGDDKKITEKDRNLAQQELGILRGVRAGDMLRSVGLAVFRTEDLRSLLLGELLFSEQRVSPILVRRVKQRIRVSEYRISDKQINDIYTGSVPRDIYWLLLKNEMQLAGIRVSNKASGKLLARIIPQLFNGATYSQLMGALIEQRGIPEKKVLSAFGKLLAVLEYAKMMCSSEDITISQIMHNVSLEGEIIDVNFVKIGSPVFAETQAEPTQQEIVEHFDKYKKFFSGAVSEENTYGFGYKLPDRVKLEYIAVKLDDVSKMVTAPTQEEAEKYYQKYRERFTEEVPSDPNDPNSPPTERIKSYAEVASDISNLLRQNKVNLKADRILQEARALTEAGLEDIDTELKTLSTEQFRQIAGDYETAADQLSKKHEIKVYSGQTGLLSAADIQTDEYLGRLYLKGYGYNVVWLTQTVFAIDELGVSELGPFDVPKPRMYENIGPIRDTTGQIVAVVRVIEAEKASEPESIIDQTFSKGTLRFEQTSEQANKDFYSVKEKVTEDLKKLAAMDTAKSKAEEFKVLAAKEGWESAVNKFNKLYGQTDKRNESDPNVFRLQSLTNLRRISNAVIETLAVQTIGNPAAQSSVDEAKKERLLRNKLYSLVPQDSNSLDTVPLVLEFKPDMSYYCLKNVSVKHLTQNEYKRIKAAQVYKEDIIQSQSLAAVHFSPENILRRMNFRWSEQEEKEADVNTPAEPEGKS